MHYLVLLLFAARLGAQPVPGYLDFPGVERKLEQLAAAEPRLVKLEVIGKSAGGMNIYAVQVAAPGGLDPARRPAVFVGANIAGYHNAGTQAALDLIERLVKGKDDPKIAGRTFYIAPALNPDAHDGMFAKPRCRRPGNAARLDKDRDGLEGEDGPNDLNGDGIITMMRIPDPAGDMIPDPKDPRLMVRADPLKGQKGAYRVLGEGFDDDGDGQFNEDPPAGYRPDKNFAHGFADNDPESGPWPSFTPEAKAVMDYLLARRNIALAFVFGPANNLLEPPRGSGPTAAEAGQMRVNVPRQMATALGLDPQQQYTADEVWKLAQAQPRGRGAGMTKEQLAQSLGGGPPTRPDDQDLKYLATLAGDYKRILEKAGLDTRRTAKQSQPGGLTNWLYYHYGVMVAEFDVWGIPQRKDAKEPASGQADLMAYIDSEAPAAFVRWTPVTLPDGAKAEVGGPDPFVDIAPPEKVLAQAAAAHTDAIIEFSSRLARVEIVSTEAAEIGPGVWRIRATAANSGFLPTHSKLGERTRNYLPVRLALDMPAGAALVSGVRWVTAERLEGSAGTLKGEWLLRARKGMRVPVVLSSTNAGGDRKEITLGGGN